MIPRVTNTKTDGNLTVAKEGARILAVIAPCQKGSFLPQLYASGDQCQEDKGHGELTEAVAYLIDATNTQVLAVRGAASVAGAARALEGDHVIGTSAVTTSGAALDKYDRVVATVVTGGTIGTAGITFTVEIDGVLSPVTRLGTATSYLIPDTGITLNFAAGTLIAGDYVQFSTTAPRMSAGDLTDALEELKEYDGEWLRVLVAGVDATDSILSQLNVEALSYHADNKWPEFFANVRPRGKDEHGVVEESRAAYQLYVSGVVGTVQSLEVAACVDECEVVSSVTGRRIRRPQSLVVAARSIAVANDAIDLAEVDLGALPGAFLTSADGLLKYHDERKYPGLDQLYVTTLRTFGGRPRRKGVYVNNARILGGAGTDYRFFQLTAVHNRCVEVVAALLEPKLSIGVIVNPNGTIRDDVAQSIEDAVNAILRTAFCSSDAPQVSNVRLQLSRTDNILATDTISYWVPIQPLGYVKEFKGKSGLVRTFATTG